MNDEGRAIGISDLYELAIALEEPQVRANFVEQACRENPTLRGRLEQLLRARADRGSFLDTRAIARDKPPFLPESDLPGSTIGPYQILEKIGEGGMGIVYKAEQRTPIRRTVAFKIVKPGMGTSQIIARFNTERQALALMDHTHIARVYDAGVTECGRPYFVMELVRGVSITEYCDREQLPIRDRIALFAKVCQAVQHAHQKAIVHRDLKPTNVLVTVIDGEAIPKVIDFGVAKAMGAALTDSAFVTGHFQIVGTPLYMSPEQADLSGVDVDTRSDIYSLGIMLYELLTGTTPIEAQSLQRADFETLRKLICETESVRPSIKVDTLASGRRSTICSNRRVPLRQLQGSLRGDLDWIVLKALDKNRQRRYESAAAFAADIFRHLRDEPVEARPPSAVYQLTKIAKRHRVILITSAVVLLSLMVGLGVSVWQAKRAMQAEKVSKASLQQARLAVDDMYTGVADKWLEGNGTLTGVQLEFLEKARDFYQRFSQVADSTPESELARLHAIERVGKIQCRLDQKTQAIESYRSAIEQSKQLIKKYPQRQEFVVELIYASAERAHVLRSIGRDSEAAREASFGHGEAVKLGETSQWSAELRLRVAISLGVLASELTNAGQLAPAEVAITRSLEHWTKLVADDSSSFEFRFGLARAHAKLGYSQMYWDGTSDKAARSLQDADRALTKLLLERPDDVECRKTLYAALTNLSVVLQAKKRNAEMLELRRRTLHLIESLAKELPNDGQIQADYASSLSNLAAGMAATEPDNEEELALLLKSHNVLRMLQGRYSTVVEYRRRYLESLIETSLRLIASGNKEKALELLSAFSPTEIGHFKRTDLASRASLCLTFRTAIALEANNYLEAARALDLCKALDGSMAFTFSEVDDPSTVQSLRASYFVNMAHREIILEKLWKQCAELAERDQANSLEERAGIVREYNANSEARHKNASAAIHEWVSTLSLASSGGGMRVSVHGEKAIQAMREDESNRGIPLPLRGAQVEASQQVFRRLIEEAKTQLVSEPSQYHVAFLLSTAPPALRDNPLALIFAEKAVKAKPEDMECQQALCWALYRNENWQACVDSLAKVIGDHQSGFVLAMAFWKLGRKDEAKAEFARARQSLEKYLVKCRMQAERGFIVLPSPRMLDELHQEARTLLGIRP